MKPRIGFSIVLNGEKHLLHNNYAEYLLENCLDFWVVVEGAAKPGGSTSWCTGDISKYNNQGHSTDNTREILDNLAKKYPNKFFYWINANGAYWSSKDEMVNAAINGLKDHNFNSGWLYQIDVDEQWTLEGMKLCEEQMMYHNADTMLVYFNQFVSKDLIARGPLWGTNGQYRLFDWHGQYFQTHEPSVLVGGTGKVIGSTYKFDHFSYVFEDDVAFKAAYYNYGPDMLERWKKLQTMDRSIFPQPLSILFPNDSRYSHGGGVYFNKDAFILKVDNA